MSRVLKYHIASYNVFIILTDNTHMCDKYDVYMYVCIHTYKHHIYHALLTDK